MDLEFLRPPHCDIKLRCARIEHSLRLLPLPREHPRNARLQNPRLFACDRLDGIAQIRLVIEGDGGDHRQCTLHDVGRIQASAQSHLHNRGFDALLAKQPESHGCDGFKVARMRVERQPHGRPMHDRVMHHVESPRKLLWSNRNAVNLNAFRRLDQMRRGKQAGAHSRRPQPRFDHRAGGTLAIGARDMHHPIRPLGVFQHLQNSLNPLQPELGRLHLVAQLVQELDGIRVGHAFKSKARSRGISIGGFSVRSTSHSAPRGSFCE